MFPKIEPAKRSFLIAVLGSTSIMLITNSQLKITINLHVCIYF